jgi:hypothetical protein
MRKYLCVAGVIAMGACGGSATNSGGGGYFFEPDSGGGGNDASSGGDDDGSVAVPGGTPLSRDLQIDHISMFQATAAIMEKGGSVPSPVNAPVLVGRDGVLRVYVNLGSSWQPHQVTCTLQLNTGGVDQAPINVNLTPSAASSDDTPGSTFDFPLTAAQITADLQYSVAIRDTTMPAQADDSTGAWYPSDGTEAAANAVPNLHYKIVLVPVQYNADGSGRLPDTSATQVQLYHDTLFTMYPALDLSFTVRSQPYPISYPIDAFDQDGGWDMLIEDIINLRQSDGVSSDTYYLAAFDSSDNEDDYFGMGGGIEGIATVAPSNDVADRVALVIGYSGPDGPNTSTQELAHAQGRYHAPCGNPQAIDPNWPPAYVNASIGVWGYNIQTKQFVNTATPMLADFMSYCGPPIWTSDYTYNALAQRAIWVNQSATPAVAAPTQPYHMVSVHADGSLAWRHPMALAAPPGGEEHTVTYHSSTGDVLSTVTGYYMPHAGTKGGHMYVPDPPAGATAMKVTGLAQSAAPLATLKLSK